MHPILKTILGVILGLLIGGGLNSGLVQVGFGIFPIGLDQTDPAFLSKLGDFLQTADLKYFVFPFLAHALGTLVGAVIAYLIAAKPHKKMAAGIIGAFFLLGGIAASTMIPAPTWFSVLDLVVSYIPMAWLGGLIGAGFIKDRS